MPNPLSMVESNNNTPLFDLPVDFIVYDDISAALLKFYANFPCKIEACIIAYVAKGEAVATINLWDYTIKENDLVVIIPGTFIQIKEVSEDIKIGVVGFSASFIKNMNFWRMMSPVMMQVLNKPVFSTKPEVGDIYGGAISLLTKASMVGEQLIAPEMASSLMEIFLTALNSTIKTVVSPDVEDKKHSSRERTILAEFMQLAFENYREEHKISFYAREVNLTLSHFCNVISKTSGMTPQEVIMSLIIMDAKTQLKGSKATVTSIAASLGFPTATTFNRYFRTYTGMTPQEYRNS